jgi:hypothetical protein
MTGEEAVYWVFAGYVSVYCFTLAAIAVWNLPSHPKPVMGALVYFVILPLLLAVLTIEPILLTAQAVREGVRRLFQEGRMSRARAFRGGVLIGVVALGTAIGIWFGLRVLTDFAWWSFPAVGLPVLLGACVGQAWIVRSAQEQVIDRDPR